MVVKTICTMEWDEMKRSGKACPCCGERLVQKQKIARVFTPYQQRGVNVHEGCYGKGVESIANDTEASNNCRNHKVTISKVEAVDVLYFTHFGFKKMGGYLVNNYDNAQSAGVVVANAIKVGYVVKVDGKKVDSVEEYDRLTKAICMR